MTIYDKLLNPYPALLEYLDLLNKQINLGLSSFNPERYGSLTAAKRNGKVFIVGIIPPDNVVNFQPVETQKQNIMESGAGTSTQSASSVAPGQLETKEQLAQKAGNKQLTGADANGPIVNRNGQIDQNSLDILSRTGFFQAVNTVAQQQNVDPTAILAICYAESKLSSKAAHGNAVGVFQLLAVEANKMSRGIAPYITKMSATQQMTYYNEYVGNFRSKYGGNQTLNALQLYLFNAGRPDLVNSTNNSGQVVLTGKDATSNPIINKDKNNEITMAEMQARLDEIQREPGFQAALEAYNNTIGSADLTPWDQYVLGQDSPGLTQNVGGENQNNGLMTYGGITQAETDDIDFRLGRNIALASQERINAVKKQTAALQQQIDLLNNMPPLLLLINPSEFIRNYEHTTDSGPKGRYGNIVHIWLEKPMKISGRGVSAGQYAIAAGYHGGLTAENRVHSLSYQNLMSLAMIYKNNGVVFTGSEVKSQAGIPILACSIYIYYDNHIYIGSFNDFSIDDDANKPFNMSYTFSFDVRYDLDVESSQLVETRIAR